MSDDLKFPVVSAAVTPKQRKLLAKWSIEYVMDHSPNICGARGGRCGGEDDLGG